MKFKKSPLLRNPQAQWREKYELPSRGEGGQCNGLDKMLWVPEW